MRRRRSFDWSTAVIAALVSAAALAVYLRDGKDRFIDILLVDFDLFMNILPKVLAGCLIGGLVTYLLPREWVSRSVGAESGFSGLLIATLAGIIVPGGPYTIFPLAAAFMAMGADAAAAITFITSWTLLGHNRILVWEMPFFGFEFAAWRALGAIPLPLFAGLLARAVLRSGRFGPRA